MGVLYIVEPFDSTDEDLCGWMEAEGTPLPKGRQKGRNPTPAEIRAVCEVLDGFETEYNVLPRKKIWQANVQSAKRGKEGTLLNIEKWGGSESKRYQISFEKGDPALILKIVHALSEPCGALLITPDSYPPLVVWKDADLKKLAKAWK